MLSRNQKKKRLKQMGAKVINVAGAKAWVLNEGFIYTIFVDMMSDLNFQEMTNGNVDMYLIPLEALE